MTDLATSLRLGTILPPETIAETHIYKAPLTPVRDGFGYYGVLRRTKDASYTQCHICGYFFSFLSLHIRKKHNTGAEDYRRQFKLNRTTKLISGTQRVKYREAFYKLSPEQREERLKTLKKGRSLGSHKALELGRGRVPSRLEEHNKRGTCPDQIMDKLERLALELRRTPTSREYRARWKTSLYPVKYQYGSWRELLNIAGLKPVPAGWLSRKIKG